MIADVDRRHIRRVLETLADTEGVRLEGTEAVRTALAWYARGLDLAHALHVASAGSASGFATFDPVLRWRASRAKVHPPVVAPP